jgi:hypothetical protein
VGRAKVESEGEESLLVRASFAQEQRSAAPIHRAIASNLGCVIRPAWFFTAA